MRLLSLTLPGGNSIQAPNGVPIGGLFGTGENIIHLFLNLAFIVSIIIALFLIVLAGYQIITSEGDKQKLQRGKDRLIFTIIGLVIILLSALVINLVGFFFHVNLINK